VNAKKLKILLMLILCLTISQTAHADSARALVEQGNGLYVDGSFNKAIEKYDAALTDKPEILEPKFNKANSFYKMEDFDKAMELYRQVASESKDMSLVVKAKYNLGNCYFEQGSRQKDSDLQKALDDLQNSIVNWRQTLEIQPDNQNAAKNIEVARLIIKDIIDQINKQKKQQEEQAKKQKEMQDKVKELLEKQKALSQKTQQTKDQLDRQQIDEQKASEDYQNQAQEQSQLQNQTEQTASQMNQQDPNNPSPQQMQQAAQEVQQAANSQKDAAGQLENSEPNNATQSQDEAVDHLEKALEKLSQGGNQKSGNQNVQPPQQEQNQTQQNQQEKMVPRQIPQDATAQDILDKEQRDRQQRQMLQRNPYQEVEKDW
jgi:Ca-activated chloride channel family protein